MKNESYILTMYDPFSHFLVAVPLESREMDEICEKFRVNIVLRYGAPSRIVGGGEFKVKDLESLLNLLKVRYNFISAYHSRSNPAERANRYI